MSSTIVVDGSVSDAIVEYGIILDSIERSHESSQLLNAIQEEDEEELVSFLNSSLDIIFKLNERDFESIFNLYLYLLSHIGNGINGLESRLIRCKLTERCLSLVDDANFKLDPSILISILTSVFNVLPTECQYRFEILSTIVDILEKTLNLKQILDIPFAIYYKWLSPLKNDDEIVTFLLSVIDKLDKVNNVESLQLFEDVVINLNGSLTESQFNKFLIASFNNEFKLDLSSYSKLKLDGASSEFKELLIFYNAKDLASFETYYQSNLTIFKDIDYDALKLKLQIIKLNSTCYGLSKISYDELFELVQIDNVEELENLIIYSIKKNFLNGKLNQFKKCLEINHAVYLGDFNLDSWKLVQSKLNNWKTSLKEIKENIDNNKKN